jgi:Trp operon repressor
MGCFSSGVSAIRKVYNEISSELGVIIAEINKVTGEIKALELNPTVAAIVAIIPGGSAVEGYINTAITEITGVTDVVKTVAEKLSEWLGKSPTTLDLNSKLIKISSMAAKAADLGLGNPVKPESTYDSAVQLRVISDKAAVPAPPPAQPDDSENQ